MAAVADLDPRKKKLIAIATVGGILGGAILLPVIFAGILGMIGIVIAAVLGLAIVNFTPFIAMKFANWKLKAVKSEAKKNPIETLQNLSMEKHAALRRFEASIADFATQVKNFESRVKEFSVKYPEKAESFRSQLDTMQKLLDHRKQLYLNAKGQLKLFDDKVEEANALWEMSQAAQQMNAAAGLQTGDPMEGIKAKTAIDSVEESLNRSVAELETSLLDEAGGVPQLTAPSSNVIELQPSSVKVGVSR